MPFFVKLISPNGKRYFVSAPDFEAMRYRTEKIESAEHFPTPKAAEDSVIEFRKIDELKDYSCSILEIGKFRVTGTKGEHLWVEVFGWSIKC